MTYRIGYICAPDHLDPGQDELQRAAKALDLIVEVISPAQLRENSPFDWLVSGSPLIGKTTSHPTFLADHRPRAAYFDVDGVFDNLASYDGYLCVGDNLARFFASIAASLDKPVTQPGVFHFLPGVDGPPTDIEGLAARDRLRVQAGGDAPPLRLVRRLGAWWVGDRAEDRSGGSDLSARLDAYRRCGAGLALAPQDMVLDDIVPETVFEIVSVAACAICPDMPAVRAIFGDLVHYYRPLADADAIADDVEHALGSIRADPILAQQKALSARALMAERFGPRAMLANLVAYYELWRVSSRQRDDRFRDALIDVVMRVGGRPVETIARAVASLEKQTAGRFRLIFAAYQPVDLSSILDRAYQNIVAIEVVQTVGGNRARTLAAGLDKVSSPCFCILDDDDYFLEGHMAGLLDAMARSEAKFRFAYCDILRAIEATEEDQSFASEISLLKSGGAHGDIFNILARLSSHCFLATSNCLESVRYRHWDLSTAEDGLLIAALLRRATPLHSPNASAVYCQGRADSSVFDTDPRRAEDELSLFTEIAPWRATIEAKFPAVASDPRLLIGPLARGVLNDKRRRAAALGGSGVVSPFLRLDAGIADAGEDPRWSEDFHGGLFADEPMVFLPISLGGGRAGNGRLLTQGGIDQLRAEGVSPWEVALSVDVSDYAIPGCSMSAVATLDGVDATVSLGLINDAEDIAAQVRLPPEDGVIVAGVHGLGGRAVTKVMVQAGAEPPSVDLVLRSLRIGYRLAELRAVLAHGETDVGREALLSRLRGRVLNQTLNAPSPRPATLSRVDFRAPTSVFRRLLKDGPYAEGALRTVTTGIKPWDYFVQIHAPRAQIGDAGWLRVVVRDTPELFYAFLVDERFETRLCDAVRVAANKLSVDIWLPTPQDGRGVYIVFQAGAAPGDRPLILERVDAAM